MKKKLLDEQLTALEKLMNQGRVEEAEKQAIKALKEHDRSTKILGFFGRSLPKKQSHKGG